MSNKSKMGAIYESDIQKHCLHILNHKRNFRVFRNNVGCMRTSKGTFMRFGLCVGSSDLIGYRTIKITDAMVGQKIAQFAAFEIKSEKGKLSLEQVDFLKQVTEAGGLARVLRSKEEAEGIF